MAKELLTDHICAFESRPEDFPPQLQIETADEPGPGGAYHRYLVTGFPRKVRRTEWEMTKTLGGEVVEEGKGSGMEIVNSCFIQFQEGGITPENPPNGVTHEALIAILIHRLRSFQNGPYPSPQNAQALHYLELALQQLHMRTRDRYARGVEGQEKA